MKHIPAHTYFETQHETPNKIKIAQTQNAMNNKLTWNQTQNNTFNIITHATQYKLQYQHANTEDSTNSTL